MRRIVLIMIIGLLGFQVKAQDPQLLENTWYVQVVVLVVTYDTIMGMQKIADLDKFGRFVSTQNAFAIVYTFGLIFLNLRLNFLILSFKVFPIAAHQSVELFNFLRIPPKVIPPFIDD